MLNKTDFKVLFEATPGLYLILLPDKNFTIVAVNDAYAQATMTIRKNILNKGLFEVFPDNPADPSADGVSNLRNSLNQVLKNKSAHTMAVQKYDIRRPDGSFEERYWSPLNKPVLNKKNEIVFIIHRVEDVTDFVRLQIEQKAKNKIAENLRLRIGEMEMEIFKRAQEIQRINSSLEQKVIERTNALLNSEKQFSLALDQMLEGIQIIDFDFRYVYVNDSVVKQGKYSRDELIGHTMMEKYPGIENTELFKALNKCIREKITISMENEFTFPDGTREWYELSIQPIPKGIFILSIDITKRKKAESEIKKLNEDLEKKVIERTEQLQSVNKELESFSYSVSHDLRSPLRSIGGFSRILEEEYGKLLDKEGKRLLEQVQYYTKKMGTLIDDLLAFSRLGRKEIQKSKINTNDLVEGVISELGQSTKSGTKIRLGKLHNMVADYSLISQVFINLISNAIKYSSKKNSICH